jgi:hypothetical protein
LRWRETNAWHAADKPILFGVGAGAGGAVGAGSQVSFDQLLFFDAPVGGSQCQWVSNALAHVHRRFSCPYARRNFSRARLSRILTALTESSSVSAISATVYRS